MKIPFTSNKNTASDTVEQIEKDFATETAEKENSTGEVSTSTKVKVVAALLVVGFAAYVAYWVQEPTDLRADVLATTQESTEPVVSENSEMVAMETPLTSEVSDTVEVNIVDFAFDPALVEIQSGTTVKWTNNDTVPHTVTGDDFTSGTLNKGETYEHTFSENGEFSYTCSFHPQMQGKVVVGAVAAEETAVPLSTTVEPEFVVPETSTEVMPVEAMTLPEEIPLDNLSPAAPEGVEIPVVPVVTTSVSSKDLSSGDLTVEEKAMAAAHGAAAEKDPKSLAKSGPEDILYVGMFVGILYLTRKKAFGFSK